MLGYVEKKSPADELISAKTALLDTLSDYLSNLPAEEIEKYPAEDLAKLRFMAYKFTVAMLAEDQNIEQLKAFVCDNLELHSYRSYPPYERASYAGLAAWASQLILEYIPKDNDDQLDVWVYRGLRAADLAIDLYARMEENENALEIMAVKVKILTCKSYHEASKCALDGVRMATDELTLNKFAELWTDIHNKRFDMFFDTLDATFFSHLPLPKETVEELAEDSPVGVLSERSFCTSEAAYDRSPIIFLEEIENAALPEVSELTEIADYVFLLDRYPAELRFDDGHPKANVLYVVDEEDDTLYHEITADDEEAK